MEQKKYFDILQIYRGIAALLVVIHHTYTSFAHFNHFDIPALAFIAKIGKLGVDFFFILSGFIITYTTFKYRGDSSYFKKYAFNRIIRVYIPYLPISLAMLALYYLLPSLSASDRSMSLLTSLTLLPHGNPALSVAWTLVFEMFFYFVFSINFFSRKGWFYFLGIWIVGIITAAIIKMDLSHPVLKLIFSLYNLEFIIGVLIAYLIQYKIRIKYAYLFSASILALFAFLVVKYLDINLFPFFQNLIFAFSAFLFVYLGVSYWNKRISTRNLFMMAGNSSYSLYLLHNPLQSILVRIFPKSDLQYFIFLEFLIVIMIIVIISYIYYMIFEKKIIAIIKNKVDIYVS
ncbi:acyltransferase [Epilithonimonas sp. JDS]|uniref:acyltransferase family protein n=1 Tax=Epilithonimonas sp. JDS TaxID=2902797 RepID=UPI001E2F00F4|nr:acyltransferase [Epilithonimonas sp. JDS]MCD9853809.1 acyltransferase [Epilithonimonas sp. JDS]